MSKMFVIFRLSILSNVEGNLFKQFSKSSFCKMSSTEKLISLDFEVFGRVQGVFFRKHTEQQAKQLGLRGWCMNTNNNTVKGVLEGPPPKVGEMKVWLERTGSPQSKIDRAVFNNEKNITKYSFDSFKIKR